MHQCSYYGRRCYINLGNSKGKASFCIYDRINDQIFRLKLSGEERKRYEEKHKNEARTSFEGVFRQDQAEKALKMLSDGNISDLFLDYVKFTNENKEVDKVYYDLIKANEKLENTIN